MGKIIRIVSLLVCVGMLSASVVFAESHKKETSGQYVDDSVITTKVKAAIFNETALKMLQINVQTYKGMVQLSGFVDSAQSVKKAGEVTKNVEGVVKVQNDLIVK